MIFDLLSRWYVLCVRVCVCEQVFVCGCQVCVCVCILVRTCVHICMHKFECTHLSGMCVCVCILVRTCVHICMHKFECTHLFVCIRTHAPAVRSGVACLSSSSAYWVAMINRLPKFSDLFCERVIQKQCSFSTGA